MSTMISIDEDADARSDGWADAAERNTCQHMVDTWRDPRGRAIGLRVLDAQGSVASWHEYRQCPVGPAEVRRVRTSAESSCERLTRRALQLRRRRRRR